MCVIGSTVVSKTLNLSCAFEWWAWTNLGFIDLTNIWNWLFFDYLYAKKLQAYLCLLWTFHSLMPSLRSSFCKIDALYTLLLLKSSFLFYLAFWILCIFPFKMLVEWPVKGFFSVETVASYSSFIDSEQSMIFTS